MVEEYHSQENPLPLLLCFETGSFCIVQAGLRLAAILLPWPSARSYACTTMLIYCGFLLLKPCHFVCLQRNSTDFDKQLYPNSLILKHDKLLGNDGCLYVTNSTRFSLMPLPSNLDDETTEGV